MTDRTNHQSPKRKLRTAGGAADGVRAVLRALGSLLPRKRRDAAVDGRVVRPWREDAFRSYPTLGLTPGRALSFLQQADAGSPHMQFELFSEMLQKWPRLAAVEQTRRLALTGLEWEIAPGRSVARSPSAGFARETEDHRRSSPLPYGRGSAGSDSFQPFPHLHAGAIRAGHSIDPRAVADFCADALGDLEALRGLLDHMALAIGYGVSVAELVWDAGRLIDVVPVPHSRLIADVNEPWRLRVRTQDEPTVGVAIDEQPFKWLVHTPRSQPGRPFEGGLLRASVLLYVAQNLSFKDWLIYSQIAGMPVRVGRFEPGTPEADKQELLRMLESLGTDAVAIFSKNVELSLVESRGGERPYEPLQNYCNSEITILWLGQHLTTDLRGEGSRAAAEIHDRVREDLLVDDIADEAATIRRDLLTPIVQARFGDGVAAPMFRRSLAESVDTRVLAETLSVAVNELGVAAPRRWAHRALGIPEPSGDEAVLTGVST